MAERTTTAVRLGRVQKQLSSWRERHGGRGRAIPEELWRAAVEVAAVAGVSETARVLGVDRERLVRRLGARPSGAFGSAVPPRTTHPKRKDAADRAAGAFGSAVPPRTTLASTAFVEVDAQRVFGRGKAIVRLTSRDGEQLEIEVEGGAMDVVAVARAFWERSR
jgi:hypothetical protein